LDQSVLPTDKKLKLKNAEQIEPSEVM